MIAPSVIAAAAIACCVWIALRLARTRAQQRETQRLLDLFGAEASDYALWMLGPSGRILQWSGGAERLHGYDAAEIVGRHCSKLYNEADRSANLPQKVLELAARAGKHAFRGERMHKDGHALRVDTVLHALRDPSGRLSGFCEIERDVSDRLEIEQTLQQTQAALMQAHKLEAIGRLSGGVAHDFNNVVQVIKNCVRVLQRRLADQPQILQFLDMIERNADRAADLSQHLLGFARLESLEPGVTNVHEVIEDAVRMLRYTLSEGIALEHRLGSAAPWTSIERNQLEASLLNLAAHARDAMPAGGTLLLETADATLEGDEAQPGEELPPYVTIRVSDSGAGRAEGARAREGDRAQRGRGPGLALTEVRQIIEQADGHVTVDARAGGGTTITLWLPRARGAGGERAAGASATRHATAAGM